MSHAVDDYHFSARDSFLNIFGACQRHQRVFPAVNDQGWRGNTAETFYAVIGGRNTRQQMATIACRIKTTVEE